MFHNSLLIIGVGILVSTCADQAPDPLVRPGIEVLVTDSLHLLENRRVGLLTNHTGIARDRTHDIELLLGAGVNLTTLFSPEHGFRGVLDQPEVAHDTDSATGLPIYSLYGDTRAPTDDMLESIDVLVVDLQDIGARPYTYISTALLAMRAAGAAGVPVVVADRPNPLGGMGMDGPTLDTTYSSFVGMLPLPQRHGMTIGELARFGQDVLEIEVDLVVVPAAGWTRDMWFDDTGLPWVRPSPNMPDLESATHYPGLVWFEATNLSVGRGTPIAFQVVGAPWLDPAAVIAQLPPDNAVSVIDTVMIPVDPPDRKYGGVEIPTIRLLARDRSTYNSSRMALRLLGAIRAVHPDSLQVRPAVLHQRAGLVEVHEVAEGSVAAEEVAARWPGTVEAFRNARVPYLLYPSP